MPAVHILEVLECEVSDYACQQQMHSTEPTTKHIDSDVHPLISYILRIGQIEWALSFIFLSRGWCYVNILGCSYVRR